MGFLALPLPIIVFIYGAIIGSFLNVVILRSMEGESLYGRSHCPHCGKTLRWYELVPILSFILLRGRCTSCGRPISPQYPLVEFLCGVGAVALYPNAALFAVFALLVVLAVVDARTFMLPDFFIVLLTVVIILFLPISYGGMLIGSGSLLFLWAITRGQGIGFGDVKLMVPLGLLFGAVGTGIVLAGAFTAGGIVGGYLLTTRRATRKTAIPFGPYLAAAAMLLLSFPKLEDYLSRIFLAGIAY